MFLQKTVTDTIAHCQPRPTEELDCEMPSHLLAPASSDWSSVCGVIFKGLWGCWKATGGSRPLGAGPLGVLLLDSPAFLSASCVPHDKWFLSYIPATMMSYLMLVPETTGQAMTMTS